MSGSWSVSGGGTGIEARFDDILSAQRVLDRAADTLRHRGLADATLAVDGAVLEAAVLCPVEVAEVEGAVASATTLPGGASWLAIEVEATALVLQSAVAIYRGADRLLADVRSEIEEEVWSTVGFAVGANPLVLAGLAALAARDPEAFEELLYENPWLTEALARGAPELVQGGLFGFSTFLGVVLPGVSAGSGPALLATLTGGAWPTGDYEQSVQGLQALAGLGGVLQDTGTFRPRRTSTDVDVATLDTSRDRFLSNLRARQSDVVYGDPPVVEIVPVVRGGDVQSYVVQIPGTDPASGFTHGTSPYDWVTDVQEMTGEASQVRLAIEQALADADLGGKPVMLSGHSLGGILASSMAADPTVRERFNVQSVVTYGSPVARFDIPEDVSVLSIEHRQDVVPMLEGERNPDGANWTTIRTDDPSGGDSIIGAHDHGPAGYGQTLARLDRGDGVPGDVRAGTEDWKDRNEVFFGDSPDAGGARSHRTYALDYEP